MTNILTIETEGNTIEIPILGNTVVKINDKIVYSPTKVRKTKIKPKLKMPSVDDEAYTVYTVMDEWF